MFGKKEGSNNLGKHKFFPEGTKIVESGKKDGKFFLYLPLPEGFENPDRTCISINPTDGTVQYCYIKPNKSTTTIPAGEDVTKAALEYLEKYLTKKNKRNKFF